MIDMTKQPAPLPSAPMFQQQPPVTSMQQLAAMMAPPPPAQGGSSRLPINLASLSQLLAQRQAPGAATPGVQGGFGQTPNASYSVG